MMRNFNRNNSSRGRDRGGDRQMHRATCSECGRSCELPFKPTGNKPVFCSDCFQSEGGGGNSRGSFRRDNSFRDNRRAPQEMHRATCAECGKSCEVPFRPSKDKPVFCDNCFDRNGAQKGGSNTAILEKLDKIIVLLESIHAGQEPPKKTGKVIIVKKDELEKEAKITTKKPAAKKVVKKTVAKKTPAKKATKKVAKKK